MVDDDRSACGRAASQRARVIVADATTDPAFGHPEAAAAAGFRAVWSVPVTDPQGRLLGVISTHYPCPWSPRRRGLQIMERYAELAAQAMTPRVAAVPGQAPRLSR